MRLGKGNTFHNNQLGELGNADALFPVINDHFAIGIHDWVVDPDGGLFR